MCFPLSAGECKTGQLNRTDVLSDSYDLRQVRQQDVLHNECSVVHRFLLLQCLERVQNTAGASENNFSRFPQQNTGC